MKAQDDDAEEVDITQVKKASTVDDITKLMDKKMKLSKKKKSKSDPVELNVPKKVISKDERMRALKNKHKNKRSRTMLKF